MATRDDIDSWFDRGVKLGATHMLVICDPFDWEDFPVYVTSDQKPRDIAKQYSDDGLRVMECYSMSIDKEEQLREFRAFHYE